MATRTPSTVPPSRQRRKQPSRGVLVNGRLVSYDELLSPEAYAARQENLEQRAQRERRQRQTDLQRRQAQASMTPEQYRRQETARLDDLVGVYDRNLPALRSNAAEGAAALDRITQAQAPPTVGLERASERYRNLLVSMGKNPDEVLADPAQVEEADATIRAIAAQPTAEARRAALADDLFGAAGGGPVPPPPGATETRRTDIAGVVDAPVLPTSQQQTQRQREHELTMARRRAAQSAGQLDRINAARGQAGDRLLRVASAAPETVPPEIGQPEDPQRTAARRRQIEALDRLVEQRAGDADFAREAADLGLTTTQLRQRQEAQRFAAEQRTAAEARIQAGRQHELDKIIAEAEGESRGAIQAVQEEYRQRAKLEAAQRGFDAKEAAAERANRRRIAIIEATADSGKNTRQRAESVGIALDSVDQRLAGMYQVMATVAYMTMKDEQKTAFLEKVGGLEQEQERLLDRLMEELPQADPQSLIGLEDMDANAGGRTP